MKSTGVVRRIDELGRIVIPKEIRRNLGIRDGENVEIFTESDSIILKKFYRMNTSSDLANTLCELMDNELNIKMIITDREKIIATNEKEKELLNKKISKNLLDIIDNREITNKDNETLKIEEQEIKGKILFVPIISLNDSIGLVILYSNDQITNAKNIGKLIASIFAKKLDI